MSSLFSKIINKVQGALGDSVSGRRFLVFESAGLFILQGGYKVLNFVTIVLLSRILTKSVYGEYALVMAWVPVISALITFGLPRLMTREIARFHISSDWPRLRGFLQSSYIYMVVFSAIASLVMWGAIKLTLTDRLPLQRAFWFGIAMVFLFSLVRLLQSTMEGIKLISLGRLPDNLIQPVVFILVILALSYFSYPLTSAGAMGLYALTTLVISVGVGVVLIRLKMPAGVFQPESIRPVNLLAQAYPFLVLNFFNVLDTRISTLTLGWLSDTGSVAVYNVITKGTDWISFSLIALSAPVARIILQRHLAGDPKGVQKIISQSTKLLTILALPLALFFFAFGRWYLGLFGSGYTDGYVPLMIIAIGELVNVASGMVGVFLYQVQHEKIVSNVIVASMILNFLVSIYAVPRYGVMGAAMAESASMIFRNVYLVFAAYKKTGINTTVFS